MWGLLGTFFSQHATRGYCARARVGVTSVITYQSISKAAQHKWKQTELHKIWNKRLALQEPWLVTIANICRRCSVIHVCIIHSTVTANKAVFYATHSDMNIDGNTNIRNVCPQSSVRHSPFPRLDADRVLASRPTGRSCGLLFQLQKCKTAVLILNRKALIGGKILGSMRI